MQPIEYNQTYFLHLIKLQQEALGYLTITQQSLVEKGNINLSIYNTIAINKLFLSTWYNKQVAFIQKCNRKKIEIPLNTLVVLQQELQEFKNSFLTEIKAFA